MVFRYTEEQIKKNKEVVKNIMISFPGLGNFHLINEKLHIQSKIFMKSTGIPHLIQKWKPMQDYVT